VLTLRSPTRRVTSITCPATPDGPDILLSSSRDKSVILWTLTREDAGPTGNYGYARRALKGHGHFVQDVVISSDGQARLGPRLPAAHAARPPTGTAWLCARAGLLPAAGCL